MVFAQSDDQAMPLSSRWICRRRFGFRRLFGRFGFAALAMLRLLVAVESRRAPGLKGA